MPPIVFSMKNPRPACKMAYKVFPASYIRMIEIAIEIMEKPIVN